MPALPTMPPIPGTETRDDNMIGDILNALGLLSLFCAATAAILKETT